MLKSKLFLFNMFLLMIFISSAFSYSPQYVDADEKIKIRWQTKRIPIAISKSLLEKTLNIKNTSDVLATIKRSLKQWEDVANIDFEITITDNENVSNIDSSGDGVSLITIAPTSDNLLLFDEKLNEASAITRLFYTSKGKIKEADIVLNPILLFTTDGTYRSFDLEATLTHELGHFLGLGHSNVFGATMHSHQGKNGIYNLPGFSSRTLSEDDKSGAISLYGSKKPSDVCCGSISGKLTNLDYDLDKQFHIWVEEINTGKVFAGVVTDFEGNYLIEGIPKSKYKLYSQDLEGEFTTVELGEIDLTKNQSVIFDREIKLDENDFKVNYLGLNGQLSRLAIPISSGKSYTLYFGGKNLNPRNLQIEFPSQNFKVIKNSLLKHNYGSGISVLSFEVFVEEHTPDGDYSFYVKNKNGSLKHLVGGLTLDNTIQY